MHIKFDQVNTALKNHVWARLNGKCHSPAFCTDKVDLLDFFAQWRNFLECKAELGPQVLLMSWHIIIAQQSIDIELSQKKQVIGPTRITKLNMFHSFRDISKKRIQSGCGLMCSFSTICYICYILNSLKLTLLYSHSPNNIMIPTLGTKLSLVSFH